MAASLHASFEHQMALGMGMLGSDQNTFQLPMGLNTHQLALLEAQRSALEEVSV